jgi:hypothetical protein
MIALPDIPVGLLQQFDPIGIAGFNIQHS